jgi:hypothetical protein
VTCVIPCGSVTWAPCGSVRARGGCFVELPFTWGTPCCTCCIAAGNALLRAPISTTSNANAGASSSGSSSLFVGCATLTD